MADGVATRCGYVAIVGAPNAGKSTLLNSLVGSKVSIVTPKVQTTRTRVLAIALEGAAQLIFVDTPGIFVNPKRRLERAMVAAAWTGASDADVVVVLVDAVRGADPDTQRIIEQLRGSGRQLLLALNKVDVVKRERLLVLADQLNRTSSFADTFMVSALTGDGVGDLRSALAARLPEGPWMFPEDQLADMPLRLLAAELTREQLFIQLHEELPYSLTVEPEKWEEFNDGSVRIDQVVTVLRDSQKPIVLGKGGRRIKAVGEAARTEIAALLERKVHLFLHVQVRENWQDDPARYRAMGLDFES
ncbi:MAG: GTPase Era [Proteobacteria bacterium]|nr:GTPase Era [Pseudomonadota bacterium]